MKTRMVYDMPEMHVVIVKEEEIILTSLGTGGISDGIIENSSTLPETEW